MTSYTFTETVEPEPETDFDAPVAKLVREGKTDTKSGITFTTDKDVDDTELNRIRRQLTIAARKNDRTVRWRKTKNKDGSVTIFFRVVSRISRKPGEEDDVEESDD